MFSGNANNNGRYFQTASSHGSRASSSSAFAHMTATDGSSETDERGSSDDSTSQPTDTILDIASGTDATSDGLTDSSFLDQQHHQNTAESTARLLHFGTLTENASFISRSRAPSPGPSQPASAANSPPRSHLSNNGSASERGSSNSAAVHIHHHYHHGSPLTSTRRYGIEGSSTAALSSRSAPASASTSHDNVPDFFLSENYRSSNLARKLGFSPPVSSADVQHYKRRNSPAGFTIGGSSNSPSKWWSARKSRRRDSNLRDPPPSYSMIDAFNLGHASSSPNGYSNGTASPVAFLDVPSGTRYWWARSRAGNFVSTCCARMLRSPLVPTQPLSILFTLVLIISFLVSTTTLTVHVLNNDKAPLPWRTFCQEQAPFPHDLADSLPPATLFVGVFSVDASYERRHLIRSTYLRHTKPVDPATGRPASNIQVKFILGRPRLNHARRVALEMETYNDIVILDLKENMNKGKTHSFFKWASENATLPFYYSLPGDDSMSSVGVAFKKADYVVKADDDAFLVLSELERHLRVSPRQHTYWGYLVRNLFMAGEAYALSSDLVDYIAHYAPLEDFVTGSEDKRVARWMRMHPNATSINWISERCWIYDHPKASTTYSHGFLFPDQVERIRQEGLRGLAEEERIRRGGEWAQSWSSVSTWKRPYSAPAKHMSMEEEVEALIEGGGTWGPEDDWKQEKVPKEHYIDYARMRFDAADARIHNVTEARLLYELQPSLTQGKRATSSSPFRYNKVPTDLIVDLREPILQHQSMADNASSTLGDGDQPVSSPFPLPKQHHVQIPSVVVPEYERLVPPPIMRYDSSRLAQRERRMLGQTHGGTVVVHFLKRNEWFMETALALLGRQTTWDSGVEAHAFAPRPLTAAPMTLPVASSLRKWNGIGIVQPIDNVWGTARMYGSPIIRSNGYIDEGREAAFERATKLPLENEPRARPGSKLRGRPRLGYADPEDPSSSLSSKNSDMKTLSSESRFSASTSDVASSEASGAQSTEHATSLVSRGTSITQVKSNYSPPPLVLQPGAGH